MPASKEKSKFKVGEWVIIHLGGIKAQILEDMGPLGVDREHVYMVLIPADEDLEAEERGVAESRLSPAA